MIKLNWTDFDKCIYSISKKCKNKSFEGVYGFPRGGLCLAVALSHSLGIPILGEPKNYSLIVDDIYETGDTLERIKHLKGSEAHVWVSKKEPTWWNAFKYTKEKEWVVFPWENTSSADNDRDLYYKSRC
tara:strand:+ start:1726 stop:2112 length:387 start_codon:yes stop_codon:yes gene_type:complete